MLGSSETGRQGVHTSDRARGAATGTFERVPDQRRAVRGPHPACSSPATRELGWLAQTGRVPRGYLGDPDKTARTFPIVDGVRYAVAGDRARVLADGSVELLGRDSVTINTGGEKVFAEEVEQAIKRHPDVFDVVVVGRPSERWGQEVVAVVQLRDRARTRPTTTCAADRRRARRALQAPEGGRPGGRGRAQPERQARLPLGRRAGRPPSSV